MFYIPLVAQALVVFLALGRLGVGIAVVMALALVLLYRSLMRNVENGNYHRLRYDDMPWLYDGIAMMAARAGIAMPRVYILEDYIPNAFSFKNALVLSLGLFEVLSENEILGVAAHEIGHIKNGDTRLFPFLAYARYWMVVMALVTLLSGHTHLAMLSFILYALYEALRVHTLKDREFMADETALHLLERPFDLKDALEELKYYEDIRMGVKASLLPGIEPTLERKPKRDFMATHPSYDERIWRILVETSTFKMLEKIN
ncbi:M48 family metallopeptidase [Palaeococcus ferrophilus]|uniref:M48 family metallopeptidase n=1 Tax=Palaeococcus ferrophilus TaxID=83868 RepID=UPI00064E765B|nr:M48 family metalloprotease [Palaeococcus ferrophilus]